MIVPFSSRLPWAAEPEGAADRHQPDTIDLTNSNPTTAGFQYPEKRIIDALAQPEILRYDPDPAGMPVVRNAISQYYDGVAGPEHIVATASTSEGYALLFKLLCDAGQSVLVPRPSYPLFDCLAGLEFVRVLPYDMHYCDGWFIDLQHLEVVASANARAIIFVNPGNPTGSFLRESEYHALVELCQRRHLALICDEVFLDFPLAEPLEESIAGSLAGRKDVLTFVLSGLSKVAGLPQMKLGWIAASGPPALRDASLARLLTIADTYLSVAGPVQHAAPELLALRSEVQPQIVNRIRRNYQAVRSMCAGSAVDVLLTQGGWSAVLRLPATRTDEEWARYLLSEQQVLTQPGYFYDIHQEACLVVSLLTLPDVFDEGIRRTILACKG